MQLNYENQTKERTQSSPSRLVLAGKRNRKPPTKHKRNNEKTHTKSKIYVATVNVLSTHTKKWWKSYRTYICVKIKWDIIGLSEVRRMGERIISNPDFLLYHIGTTPGHHGVGSTSTELKYLSNYVESFIGISERIVVMNIKLPGYKDCWSLIQVYSQNNQI